jgi:hypothetical protein
MTLTRSCWPADTSESVIATTVGDLLRDGEQIYPREVENELSGHPEVGDAIVLGVPDRRWGQQDLSHARDLRLSEPADARRENKTVPSDFPGAL